MLNGDMLLKLAKNSNNPIVIKTSKKVQNIIDNAKLYEPIEYEMACLDLKDAIEGAILNA